MALIVVKAVVKAKLAAGDPATLTPPEVLIWQVKSIVTFPQRKTHATVISTAPAGNTSSTIHGRATRTRTAPVPWMMIPRMQTAVAAAIDDPGDPVPGTARGGTGRT
jgi:hypothetical protein